jgi:hypothetical protein
MSRVHGYTHTKAIREERRATAQARQTDRGARNSLTQLERLDTKLGVGVGARKERARLAANLRTTTGDVGEVASAPTFRTALQRRLYEAQQRAIVAGLDLAQPGAERTAVTRLAFRPDGMVTKRKIPA